MSDLINREDAIEACCRGWNNTAEDCIRNIKELPSAELPKGELISRADAIAYIDRVINSGLGRNKSLDYIRKYISALPSAEPTGDLISRADAIDAVADEWLSEASAESPYVNDDDIGEYRKLAEKLFEDVPSADAEGSLKAIKRQIDEHWYLDAPSAEAVHGEWIFNPIDAIDLMFAKPKCSKCGFESSDGGNFCPNCGARMLREDGEA